MNIQEFQSLKDIWETPREIGIDDLFNRDDRTLLWGYTCDRDSWHVYIESGEIHTVMYDYPNILKLHPVCCATNNPQDWIPNKRLYPEACDYDFCKLLKEYGCYLPFTTWNDSRKAARYHGLILSELKTA